jgi:hypothetical protein
MTIVVVKVNGLKLLNDELSFEEIVMISGMDIDDNNHEFVSLKLTELTSGHYFIFNQTDFVAK